MNPILMMMLMQKLKGGGQNKMPQMNLTQPHQQPQQQSGQQNGGMGLLGQLFGGGMDAMNAFKAGNPGSSMMGPSAPAGNTMMNMGEGFLKGAGEAGGGQGLMALLSKLFA